MEKVYTLPDILPAPTSDLQLLVRRLIEYADWSVLPALLDEVRAQGREREIRWLQGAISRYLLTGQSFKDFVHTCLTFWWFDLFDPASTAVALDKKGRRASSIVFPPSAPIPPEFNSKEYE